MTIMQVHAELILEVPVEHGLLLENLLDLAHAPFTHTSTFAKGWPVPDVVKFNAARMLGGNWEPYPIDMAFEPPCMVLSTIGAPLQTSARQKWKRPLIVRKDALNCLVIGPLCEQMPARITRKSFSSLKKGSRCILCSRGTV
jgi:hypothetical protein